MKPNTLFMFHQVRFLKSAAQLKELPEDQGKEVAFIGYSNTGKSSTINRITQAGLAKVSKTPGRTQLFNSFAIDSSGNQRLIDLPGYGYAKAPPSVRQTWMNKINRYLTQRHSLSGLILIMDIRHPLKPLDLDLITWCTDVACPMHGLLNKADKLSYGAAKQALLSTYKLAQAHEAGSEKKSSIHLQLFSAKTGLGLPEAQTVLSKWLTINPNETT